MIARQLPLVAIGGRGRARWRRLPPAACASLAVLAALYVAVPALASAYQVYVLSTILVACIGALGLNLLTGYAGQVSIGQGGFLGVGAFTSALLASRTGVPFWLSVPAAGLVTALVGLVFGLPSARIKGLYLAIATLAAQVIIQWTLSRPAIAGGGSVAAPRPGVLQDDRIYYLVVLSVALLAVAFARNVLRTRVGRALVAVRDHEVAPAMIGVDVAQHKLLAFGLSALYAGIAGALLGHLGRAVTVEQFQLDLSIQYLAMIVIGGLGSLPGSILGALFVTLLPILLRAAVAPIDGLLPGSAAMVLSSVQVFLFGLIIVVCMAVEPRGLARLWARLGGALTR
ncbi:MAG: branched-chain amino acid ABC transporter permease [Chloroflexi bacterium]|nr:branched-chain amino acid ABC transporter permease [Chloroflexota bacterium]